MSSGSHLFAGLIIPEGTVKESSTMEEFLFWQIYPSFWLHATFSHLPFLPWKVPHIFISSTEGFPLGKKHNIQRISLLTPNIFISPQKGMHSHNGLSAWFFRVRTPRSTDEETPVSPLEGPTFQMRGFPLSHAQLKEKMRVFETLQHTEKHFIKIQLRHNSLWVGIIAKHSISFAVKKWMWNLYWIPHKCSPFGFSCHQNCYYEIMFFSNMHYGELNLERYSGNLFRVYHIDIISNT